MHQEKVSEKKHEKTSLLELGLPYDGSLLHRGKIPETSSQPSTKRNLPCKFLKITVKLTPKTARLDF